MRVASLSWRELHSTGMGWWWFQPVAAGLVDTTVESELAGCLMLCNESAPPRVVQTLVPTIRCAPKREIS